MTKPTTSKYNALHLWQYEDMRADLQERFGAQEKFTNEQVIEVLAARLARTEMVVSELTDALNKMNDLSNKRFDAVNSLVANAHVRIDLLTTLSRDTLTYISNVARDVTLERLMRRWW